VEKSRHPDSSVGSVFLWSSFPFLRFTLALIAGILLAIFSPHLIPRPINLFALCLPTYIFCWFVVRKPYLFRSIFLGITGISLLILFGYNYTLLQQESNLPSHLLNVEPDYYTATVISPPEEKTKTIKTLVSVDRVKHKGDWACSTGKVILYLTKKSEIKLKYGDQLLISGSPQIIPGPANPNEFDYKSYLAYRNIYHRQFIDYKQVLTFGYDPPYSLLARALHLRNRFSKIIEQTISSAREQSVAKAIILGDRQQLEPELKSAYGNAGIMHILAVSGLHVGIIYLIILVPFGNLRYHRRGRFLFFAITLLTLWSYAFITGFSPSVLRAVTMFSFIALAQSTNQHSNIYNTLAISAFTLLIWDPFLIMHVGFQLSYLAVLGIIYFTPKIYQKLYTENWLPDKIWMITCVSLGAQLATTPLTVYYFNQFPLYFLITNLVAIPSAFLMVAIGFVVLLFSFLTPLAKIIGNVLESVIWLTNEIIVFSQMLPYQTIELNIDTIQVISIYLMLAFLTLLFIRRHFTYSFCACFVIAFFSYAELGQVIKAKARDQITFYNINGNSVMSRMIGNKAYILSNNDMSPDHRSYQFNILPHLKQEKIEDIHFARLSDIDILHPWRIGETGGNFLFVINKKRFAYIFSELNGMPPKEKLKLDILILTQAAAKNFNILRNFFDYQQLIIDSSVPPWDAEALELVCKQEKIDCKIVRRDGAWTLNL